MWQWLEQLLYGTAASSQLMAIPPARELAEARQAEEARGRTSLVFDSHVMTEAAGDGRARGKNPQAVSLAWDEGRAYGFNVAPQSWLGMTPRERKETLLSIFLANPWASNSIDTIALYITSGGYTIEPRPGIEHPDKRQRDEIDAFLQRVNEDWDFTQLVYDVLTDEMIFGESFIEFTMKGGKPFQLFSTDCLTIDTDHDKYGRVTRYKQQLTSTSVVQDIDPRVMIRWWNPHKRAKVDPFSPLERIQDAILLDKKMTNWMTTFFQKGAKFPYSIEGITDEDEADRFLTWFKANYTGEKNAQSPVTLWGGAKLVPAGKGSIDIDFERGLDRMQTIVLSTFHVPPSVAGIPESGNRLTERSDGQRKILQYISCDPRRHRFLEKFNWRLIAPFWSDYVVGLRYADFRDDEALAKVADTRIRNGSLTINEVRQESGRDAYKQGGNTAIFATGRDITTVERIDEMNDEQRAAAQVSLKQAKAQADLATTQAKQAKVQRLSPLALPRNARPQRPATPQAGLVASQGNNNEEESVQQAATDGPHTGMMLALLLDPTTATQLAIPGGEPANDLHITLAYLGDMEDEETDGRYRPDTRREPFEQLVHAIASTASPLAGRIGGLGRFHPAETDTTPVVALVDMPGLAELRTELVDALNQANYFVADTHGYTPHVTLAYIDQDAPMSIKTVPPLTLTFGQIWLCIGDERIPFKLGGDLSPETKEPYEQAQQTAATQSRETDVLTPGADQETSDRTLSEAGNRISAGREQRGADLAAWIADLFQTVNERGAGLAPTRETTATAYALTQQEQEAFAQQLAEAANQAYQDAYKRAMTTVGLAESVTPATIEEAIFPRAGGVLEWARDQVIGIANTLKEQLTSFVSHLSDKVTNVAEQVAPWLDRYSSYKSEQITNVTVGTGDTEGTQAAIRDIIDMQRRIGSDVSKLPSDLTGLTTKQIRVKVVPEESSSDFCKEWAGKSVPIEEADTMPFFPYHPNCIHGFEVYVAEEGED